ncbi:MAG: ABC transporter ATP-binding protein, partial [Ruthenibacterium sp.]
MQDTVIEVSGLCKDYALYDQKIDRLREALDPLHKKRHHVFKALHDVNFSVHKGETVGIIGTNGSGKSTLLKILTGVVTPTSGTVTVNGKISALLELGAGFNPEYTGMQNIYLNGTIMGYTEDDMHQKVPGIIEFAGIGDFINQPVKTYSSGMFARLAFAVAISVEPDVLIVDEALSVGDVFFQSKCFKKFEQLQKLGTTILLVSHDLGSITQYCSRAILLNQGILITQGSPKEVVDVYKKILVNQYNPAEKT